MQTSMVAFAAATAVVAAALGGLYLTRRWFPHPVREANNEVAGFLLAAFGALYGALLAFVVVAVWEDYEESRTTTEREANALVSLYRIAEAIPTPTGPRLVSLSREYAEKMGTEEWPLLGRGRHAPLVSGNLLDSLWLTAFAFQPANENERLLYGQALAHLSALNDDRRLRVLAAHTGLPSAVWTVLTGGAIISVLFSYFFGTPNPRGHYAMTALFVASIALVLALIWLLDYPFSGDVKVTPEAFETALETFDRLEGR